MPVHGDPIRLLLDVHADAEGVDDPYDCAVVTLTRKQAQKLLDRMDRTQAIWDRDRGLRFMTYLGHNLDWSHARPESWGTPDQEDSLLGGEALIVPHAWPLDALQSAEPDEEASIGDEYCEVHSSYVSWKAYRNSDGEMFGTSDLSRSLLEKIAAGEETGLETLVWTGSNPAPVQPETLHA